MEGSQNVFGFEMHGQIAEVVTDAVTVTPSEASVGEGVPCIRSGDIVVFTYLTRPKPHVGYVLTRKEPERSGEVDGFTTEDRATLKIVPLHQLQSGAWAKAGRIIARAACECFRVPERLSDLEIMYSHSVTHS